MNHQIVNKEMPWLVKKRSMNLGQLNDSKQKNHEKRTSFHDFFMRTHLEYGEAILQNMFEY